jgi:type I restriction enzyme S subunit
MSEDGEIDYSNAPRTNLNPARFGHHFLKIGDIVVSRSGTCGIASVFEGYQRPVLPGAFLIRLRMRDEVWPQYLRHYLNSPKGRASTALIAEGAIQKNISGTRLQDLVIPLPPREEQVGIARLLSAVQRAIERQERLIALTVELKKALMHKLFTEGTRGEPLKQTEIGPVPESWTVAPLKQFTESFQYGTSVKCSYDVKGGPVLRIPNVVGGHLDVNDLKFGNPKKNELETVRLRSGDLLFVRTNGVRENAGRCSMYRGELGESCYFASYLIRVRLHNGLIPEFLEEYTRTEVGVRLLAGRAARTADGKFNINTGTLETLLVPKPNIDEQKAVADALGLIDRKARNHRATKAILEALFRTLLSQLMTAQVRVCDLDLSALDEPAAESAGVA